MSSSLSSPRLSAALQLEPRHLELRPDAMNLLMVSNLAFQRHSSRSSHFFSTDGCWTRQLFAAKSALSGETRPSPVLLYLPYSSVHPFESPDFELPRCCPPLEQPRRQARCFVPPHCQATSCRPSTSVGEAPGPVTRHPHALASPHAADEVTNISESDVGAMEYDDVSVIDLVEESPATKG